MSYLSAVNVYAPNYRSSQEQKDMLYDDLCCTIVSEDDVLIVLGDCTRVHVGTGTRKSPWNGELEAGIYVCALNGLTVMNTWFEKKHMYTSIPGNTLIINLMVLH